MNYCLDVKISTEREGSGISGSKEGGSKAAKTNKEKYGKEYYSEIGKKGAEAYRQRQALGIASPRGFAANRELARTAGARGGKISRRGKSEKAA